MFSWLQWSCVSFFQSRLLWMNVPLAFFFLRIFQTHWVRKGTEPSVLPKATFVFCFLKATMKGRPAWMSSVPRNAPPLLSRHFSSRVRSGMQHFWPVSMLIFYLMAHKSKSGLEESWSTHYMVINSQQRQAVLQGVTAPTPLPSCSIDKMSS